MKNAANQQLQAPPGVIATLTAGFELTTAHIWLIVLPCLLDVLYWLGPRLGVARLADRNLAPLVEEPATQEAATQLVELASQVNVLTGLSLPLVGVPALMSGAIPEKTPLPVQVVEMDRLLIWALVFAAVSLAGLLMAATYLSLIALALKSDEDRPDGPLAFTAAVLKSTVRLFGLAIVFVMLLLIVWLPLLPIALLVSLLAGSMAILVMLAGFVLVVTYLSLSVPGIVLHGRPLLPSVWESVRLVHRNALQTTNLLLIVVLIGAGTNMLWRIADDGSWITLVSIVGHAFISTALMAAVFVYYRDRWTLSQAQPQAQGQES